MTSISLLLLLAATVTVTGYTFDKSRDAVPLKEAKLIIEHNAKDLDTGFQGYVDGEGWKEMTIEGPKGPVLTIKGRGELGKLGLTELFFESVEPENVDVTIPELLKALPEGTYTFKGTVTGEKGQKTIGKAWFTHAIPNGPILLAPEEDEVVSRNNLVAKWSPVTTTIYGKPVKIISYQLIIEKDEAPNPNMIGKKGLSMYLPPTTHSMTIPREFLEPNTEYVWEVLAIEESGNQALTSGAFSTSS